MNFKKSWVMTKDGSHTLKIDSLKETYHSLHGAVEESQFVYIEKGLRFWQKNHPKSNALILEMGYGTGLLAYLSLLYQQKSQTPMGYTSVEAYPLSTEELERLNYNDFFGDKKILTFLNFSKLPWEISNKLNPQYTLLKRNILFQEFETSILYDVIYYDAFGAHAQPELWEVKWIKKCFDLLNSGGVWVSFCAKGTVRRALQQVGFQVERLPGSPGKREMLRAIKP